MHRYTHKSRWFSISVINCCFVLNLSATNSITLVSHGSSNYSISISANASAQEKKAGSLLQDYIQKISGCTIPIVPNANGN